MSSTQDTIQNFEKVSDLFFDKGDIVISAQRPGSDTISLFKLHRRVLATHAKGLSGLMLPEAASGAVNVNEYFEGTPVVRLFDDPADLAIFFKAMYVPSTLIFRRSMATNAADAFPILVLADKYVADDIECMIEYQIRQDWPKSVYEWDAFENRAVHMYRMHQQRGSDGPWDILAPEPASYIRLARVAKVTERTRIGAAFYQLSRMKAVNDWETKSIAGGHKDPTPTQLAKMRRAMWSILSKDELYRMERGKKKLASHVAKFVRTLPNEMDLKCAEGWNMVAAKLMKSDDILADLLKFCSAETTGLRMSMCDPCLRRVSKRAKEQRKEIWAKLPDYFEVYPNERAYLDTFCAAESEFVLM